MSDAPKPMTFIERLKDIRRRRVVRKFIERHVRVVFMFFMLLIKPFPFLHRLLPRGMREFLRDWTPEMMRKYIFSLGRRAYIDQPCTIRDPKSYRPLVETSAEYRLSEEDIRSFYANGFLGPFTLCPREEMIELRDEVMREIEQPSKIYGFQSGRDRHLDCESVCRLVMRPALTERLAQLLGPNLLLWRSQVFLKPPGAPEITWHQASTYLSEEAYKATLFPPDRDQLFQLTTWLAFDDVDLANGCMQFLRGTHRSMKTVRLGGRGAESFAKSAIKLEYDIDPKEVVTMEMKAGQFIIFTERTIHGSPPNKSDRRRWGMAFRTILPEVLAYGDDVIKHRVAYLEEEYDLTHWGAIVLRGRDTAGINRLKDPFPHLRQRELAAV
jgi:non-heme Fe2+,alpha-ketoglutarate-dependent halogenase